MFQGERIAFNVFRKFLSQWKKTFKILCGSVVDDEGNSRGRERVKKNSILAINIFSHTKKKRKEKKANLPQQCGSSCGATAAAN